MTAIKFMKNKNKQDAMLVQRLEQVEKQLAEMNHHVNKRSE
ncbi:hypothetical protein C2W64_04735 [Brevibacillus laterosporus]|nr:hypothetical protein C2W64_04735 [Brevibacillus laterosporus]